ncbi:MAG: helix-turn-helix domain-containing transcriptional regulator [Candidatus Dormibacteria bacterium]
MSIDTTYHQRRVSEDLKDPEFRAEYDRARREISQIDAIVRALDSRREELGWSKAELARAVGKNPASVRRLFSSSRNPEFKMITAITVAMGGEMKAVFPRRTRAARVGRNSRKKTAA